VPKAPAPKAVRAKKRHRDGNPGDHASLGEPVRLSDSDIFLRMRKNAPSAEGLRSGLTPLAWNVNRLLQQLLVIEHSVTAATDEDLRRANYLVMLLFGAIAFSTSDHWRRISKAYEAAVDGDDVQEKRRRIVYALELYLQSRKIPFEWSASMAIQLLASHEASFQRLQPDFVSRELKKLRPAADVRKGGAGNVGPAHVAAKFAVRVGAFGDDNEVKSKKRFLEACLGAGGASGLPHGTVSLP